MKIFFLFFQEKIEIKAGKWIIKKPKPFVAKKTNYLLILNLKIKIN